MKFIMSFSKINKSHTPLVGGKTSSLGEMYSLGLPVPNGFAITAEAYRYFIKKNKLDHKIRSILNDTNVRKINELTKTGKAIRSLIRNAQFPKNLEKQIFTSFRRLGSKHVAVRSSATAEDLPSASFAGQQESFLNVTKKDILSKVRECFASLFTDRAISYREDKKFDHFKVYLSVAVEIQIFSETSGVMFTLEPDTGHRNFIIINASFGLGDYIVQGKVVPDEFWVFKKTCKIIDKKLGNKSIMEVRSAHGVKKHVVPWTKQKQFSLTDKEAENLAKYAKTIERHYGRPMDIEWAKHKGKLYIIQARPETVHSTKDSNVYKEYTLIQKGKTILEGAAVGRMIASGTANVIKDVKKINRFKKGQILVTTTTNPDWEPIMKIAKGIITEEGGRTSHAAIISRELGVSAIVGAKNATNVLRNNMDITLDCTQENGRVLKGLLKYKIINHSIKKIPKTKTKVYVNIGQPDAAVDASLLPVDGVGLAREEFILSTIGLHPLYMIKLKKEKQFIEKLTSGIAKIAASFYPRPVIVRTSDFKTNEYRNLRGGKEFEPQENNPMIGWRGTSRYIDPVFEKAFRLECRALKRVIDMGLNNIKVMLPFCRTIDEAKQSISIIKQEKVKSEVGVMAEVPSTLILADKFSQYFTFFSIGSNDLTQLTLGIDRDNERLAKSFNERNPAVKKMISLLIRSAHKKWRTVGICGDAPSTYPEFSEFLVREGIDSLSVTPDAAIKTKLLVSKIERR